MMPRASAPPTPGSQPPILLPPNLLPPSLLPPNLLPPHPLLPNPLSPQSKLAVVTIVLVQTHSALSTTNQDGTSVPSTTGTVVPIGAVNPGIAQSGAPHARQLSGVTFAMIALTAIAAFTL